MIDLLKALASLNLSYDIVEDDGDTYILLLDRDIKIFVSTTYWRYPGLTSYFVNYHKDNDNFACHAGTLNLYDVIYFIGLHTPKD
jgi:hypothetical protein